MWSIEHLNVLFLTLPQEYATFICSNLRILRHPGHLPHIILLLFFQLCSRNIQLIDTHIPQVIPQLTDTTRTQRDLHSLTHAQWETFLCLGQLTFYDLDVFSGDLDNMSYFRFHFQRGSRNDCRILTHSFLKKLHHFCWVLGLIYNIISLTLRRKRTFQMSKLIFHIQYESILVPRRLLNRLHLHPRLQLLIPHLHNDKLLQQLMFLGRLQLRFNRIMRFLEGGEGRSHLIKLVFVRWFGSVGLKNPHVIWYGYVGHCRGNEVGG